ncbi:MAG: hypothetical protein HW402_499 [Dehalococcoidales bacterium]|nr:hypothetical protein [Dehalococcoidales bacterium]
MTLNTCSETISFARELEESSARFYQDLSQRSDRDKDFFLSLVKENGKNIVAIERAYYGVISDAIEGCFAFSLSPDEYRFDAQLAAGVSYPDALTRAVEIEEKMSRFYTDAAAQSKSLMADVPRALALVARKRSDRLARLKALFN